MLNWIQSRWTEIAWCLNTMNTWFLAQVALLSIWLILSFTTDWSIVSFTIQSFFALWIAHKIYEEHLEERE